MSLLVKTDLSDIPIPPVDHTELAKYPLTNLCGIEANHL